MVVIEGLLAVIMVITTVSSTKPGGHVVAWWSLKAPGGHDGDHHGFEH